MHWPNKCCYFTILEPKWTQPWEPKPMDEMFGLKASLKAESNFPNRDMTNELHHWTKPQIRNDLQANTDITFIWTVLCFLFSYTLFHPLHSSGFFSLAHLNCFSQVSKFAKKHYFFTNRTEKKKIRLSRWCFLHGWLCQSPSEISIKAIWLEPW